MRDFDKVYRKAIFDSLTSISVSVYDEVKKVGDSDTIFVILGTQRFRPEPVADTIWGRRCSIDIVIMQKTGASVSKDDIDDVASEVEEAIIPTYTTSGLSEPSGFQFGIPECEQGVSQRVILSSTESVIAKTLTISCVIIQQL